MTASASSLSPVPLLQLRNLAAGYDGHALYRGVDISVDAGQLVSVLGANGAGKSTLLRCLTGTSQALEGTVEIAGGDIAGMPRRKLARLVSVVNTSATHAGALTVEELVALGRQPYTGFFGRLDEADRKAVDSAIEMVGMSAMRERHVASLSDGERQKAMIARALAQQTPLMVLDEPTAFLDVASRLEVMQLLATLARREGKAIVMSTHDVASALRLSDAVWLIADNDSGPEPRTVAAGSPRQLIDSGRISNLFPHRKVHFSAEAMDFIPG